MDFIFDILGFLPFLFIAGIIALIVTLANRRSRGRAKDEEPGTGARQAFFYLFSFAALMVAANGSSVLLSYIVDSLRGGDFISPDDNQLALGIALLVVGTPAWLLTWRRILTTIAAEPHERRGQVRGLYIYVTEAVSIGFLASGLVSLINTVLGGEGLEGTYIAWPVTWGAIWAYHWWVDSKLSAADRAATPFRALYVYGASAAFLAMLLTGSGLIIQRLLDSAYISLFRDDLLVSPPVWGDGMKTSIAVAIVGGLSWWWHWFRAAPSDVRTSVRQIYIYIFGILFGVITSVVAASVVAVLVLQWLLSMPSISPANEHFQSLTSLIPALLAGGVLWSFHAGTLGTALPGADAPQRELAERAQRAYNYLVASLSLATLASGLIFLIALFISATVQDARNYLVDEAGWQGQLSIVLPLLGVGGGIWAYYWFRIQRQVISKPDELETSPRKIHIYSVFGVSALAALGSLSTALFLFLEAVFDGTLGAETLRDTQWAIAILATSGVLSGYFWLVIREDRHVLAIHGPPQIRVQRKAVTVLIPETLEDVADRLQAALGYSVTVWLEPREAAVPPPTDEQVADAASRITAATSDRVLVVISGSGMDVRPYRRE